MPLSTTEIAALRRDYSLAGLHEEQSPADPFLLFQEWLTQAVQAELPEPNAMVLGTVSPQGQLRTRVVLLKGCVPDGFLFYSNYESTKAQHLALHPQAALNFHWADLERQVCLEGVVKKISREDSARYFHSRPRNSQLGAWVSRQSAVIPDRHVLEQREAELMKTYADVEVPLPEFWGGYQFTPQVMEFWQGRPSRLHDRLRYTRGAEQGWLRERLSP
jgi:pyridoxamine 5'-phosphate oxidase